MDGVITDAAANMIVMKLLYLQSREPAPGHPYVCQFAGGSVTPRWPFTTRCSSSNVSRHLLRGPGRQRRGRPRRGRTAKKRFCLPHSKMMIHQPYGEVGGQVSDIEIQAKDILPTREVLNEILAKHTGQPIEVIARDTDRDRFLTSRESVEYGLVDEILSRPPKSKGDTKDKK